MIHLFAVAMVWHDKPIKLHVCPPTDAQVRQHVAMRDRCPSGTQVQVPGVEEVA